MPDPQVGDRIRLTHEGVLTHISKSYINDSTLLTLDNATTFALTEGRYDVEILERAKPKYKVGDIVRTVRAIDFPVGTLLSAYGGDQSIPDWVRTSSGEWLSLDGSKYAVAVLSDHPRTIIHIPEE